MAALARDGTIRSLSLTNNSIRTAGARAVACCLAQNTTLESVDLTGSLDGAPPEADDEDKDLERKAHAALVSRAHVAAGVIANTASRLGRLNGLALGESLRDLGAGGDELLALENATLLPWLQDRARDEAALAVSRGGAPKPATQLLLTNATKVPFDMTELKELYRHYFCAAVPRDFDEAPDDRAPPPFRGLGDRKGQAEAICLSDKWRRVSAYPKFAQAIEGLLAARAASRDRRERRSVLGKVLGLLRQLRYYAMQERDDWLSRRTLIVDDSQTMRALLRRTFENAGFSVDCASDGREAYEAMKGTRYDMVVMDLDMPVMDGVASTASIRQWERATPSTTPQRICAISADTSAGSQARQAGANFFEAKPLKMAGLLEKTHEEIHATVSACETARQPADLPPSTAAPSASGDCAEGLSDGLLSGFSSDGELSLGSFGGPRGFALMPTLPPADSAEDAMMLECAAMLSSKRKRRRDAPVADDAASPSPPALPRGLEEIEPAPAPAKAAAAAKSLPEHDAPSPPGDAPRLVLAADGSPPDGAPPRRLPPGLVDGRFCYPGAGTDDERSPPSDTRSPPELGQQLAQRELPPPPGGAAPHAAYAPHPAYAPPVYAPPHRDYARAPPRQHHPAYYGPPPGYGPPHGGGFAAPPGYGPHAVPRFAYDAAAALDDPYRGGRAAAYAAARDFAARGAAPGFYDYPLPPAAYFPDEAAHLYPHHPRG